jgi:regulatory protein
MDSKKAYDKAAAICARQEQCISMVREKLIKWEVEEAERAKILARLVEEKFIDELRYTGFYVRDKARFNKWGKTKITWQLRRKGISPEMISEALASIPANEYSNNLLDLLRQKKRQLKVDDPYKRRASLMRFAASRGFSFDEIKCALDELGSE